MALAQFIDRKGDGKKWEMIGLELDLPEDTTNKPSLLCLIFNGCNMF
jgi:hypothetical protein